MLSLSSSQSAMIQASTSPDGIEQSTEPNEDVYTSEPGMGNLESLDDIQSSSQSDTNSHSDFTDSETKTEPERRDPAQSIVNIMNTTNGEKQPLRNYGNSDSVDLYCRKVGKSHGHLLDFGAETCPMCDQDLRPTKRNGEHKTDNSEKDAKDAKEDAKEDDKEDDMEDDMEDAKEKEVAEEATPDITYKVRYKDRGNFTIATQAWGGPFDLERARGRPQLREDKLPVLEIITVLATSIAKDSARSIPKDSERLSSEVDQILKEGILNNKKVSVTVAYTEITIYSPALIKVLRRVVSYYPEVYLAGSSITLREPYCMLAHHMKELEDFQRTYRSSEMQDVPNPGHYGDDFERREICDEETYNHIIVLRDVYAATHGDRIEKEEERHAHKPPLATFPMLWLLLKPGATVYAEVKGKLWACVIESVIVDPSVAKRFERWKSYHVNLWFLDFNGQYLGRRSQSVTIPEFEGEREITSLSIIPSEYLDKEDRGALRKRLENRGKKFYSLLSGAQMHYSGDSLGSRRRRVSRLIIPQLFQTYRF